MSARLVERFVVLIHPLVLGTRIRLFQDAPNTPFDLVGSNASSTGVIMATYQLR